METIHTEFGYDGVSSEERIVDLAEASFVRADDDVVDTVLRQEARGVLPAGVCQPNLAFARTKSTPCDQTWPGYPISDRRPLKATL